MKYFGEKEKKLKIALDKLKKLNLIDEDSQNNLKFLSDQKNQLEIEKKELQSKHKNLISEHHKLKDYLKSIEDKNSIFLRPSSSTNLSFFNLSRAISSFFSFSLKYFIYILYY